MQHPLGAFIVSALVLNVTVVGCHRAEDNDEPITECNTYAEAFDRCVHRLTAGADSVASERAKKLRSSLEAQIHGAGREKRTELRASCVAGLQQLETSCR